MKILILVRRSLWARWMVAALALLVMACTSTTTTESSTTDSTATAAIAKPADTVANFVNWPEVGIRETAGDKGKYLTTVFLGESVALTGDTASEASGKQKVHYNKIRLSDGKEGWIRTDFLGLNSKPAVVKRDVSISSRPDGFSVTAKEFATYEVIAVRWVQHGWYEAKGKAKGENWFTNGYISSDAIITDPVEVQFAAIKKRAEGTKDAKLKGVLEAQLKDPRFENTAMHQLLFGKDDGIDYSLISELSVEFLIGRWKNEWTDAAGGTNSETFEITDDYRVILDDGTHVFNIADIEVFNNGQSMKFTKVGAAEDDDRRLVTEVKFVSGSRIEGMELRQTNNSDPLNNTESRVVYTRN